MSGCVVVGCESAATDTVDKATPGGVWTYRVCDSHAAEVRAGAAIHDNPDGHSVVLESDRALPADPELRSGSIGVDSAAEPPEADANPKDFRVVQS